uniref:ATP-dependent DNA helicase n=1 Tax=Tanacetum cinerariifolium TaxID=118510 RepID=A0A6L2KQM7_TANCI|nr:hypothetical protein [Tanacetum cinerariifolium]
MYSAVSVVVLGRFYLVSTICDPLKDLRYAMLNTKLVEAESMTHDVICDLLGVKLDMTNYALVLGYLSAPRNEGLEVDRTMADHDAKALFKAGEKRHGTDEKIFRVIFRGRNVIGDITSCGKIETHKEKGKKLKRFIRIKMHDTMLLENLGGEVSDHQIVLLVKYDRYDVCQDFLVKLQKVNLADIRDIVEIKSVIVVATIKVIERENKWYYLACGSCTRIVDEKNMDKKDSDSGELKKQVVFICSNKECGEVTNVCYKGRPTFNDISNGDQVTPKHRGRPSLNDISNDDQGFPKHKGRPLLNDISEDVQFLPKRRGRPPMNDMSNDVQVLQRRRGRPPLNDLLNATTSTNIPQSYASQEDEAYDSGDDNMFNGTSIEYLDHGDPTVTCGACGVVLWAAEARLKRSFCDGSSTGRRIIVLSSSFTGGARYMRQNYLDAMSLFRWLPFYLPGQQQVVYESDDDISDAINKPSVASLKFLGCMECNKTNDLAKTLSYVEFHTKFVWKAEEKVWQERKRGYAVGRIHYVPPSIGKTYYLRVLLHKQKGPENWNKIKELNDIVHPTYRNACYAIGLLDDDREYIDAIEEANSWACGEYVRKVFARLLTSNTVSRPDHVWNETWRLMSSLDSFLWMPLPDMEFIRNHTNILIHDELCYNKDELVMEHETLFSNLTSEQKNVYPKVMKVVEKKVRGVFFLYGYGGTGKTYVLRTLSATLSSKGEIVLNMASSGIASLLLSGGRTTHS